MKMLMSCFVLGADLLGNVVYAATLNYAAQEEIFYTGDEITSDSGSPIDLGNDGDVFLQYLVYSAQLETTAVDASVTWDEAIEQLM